MKVHFYQLFLNVCFDEMVEITAMCIIIKVLKAWLSDIGHVLNIIRASCCLGYSKSCDLAKQ
jgi:hypothetical protein